MSAERPASAAARDQRSSRADNGYLKNMLSRLPLQGVCPVASLNNEFTCPAEINVSLNTFPTLIATEPITRRETFSF
jgi:hypothetical protein